MLLRRRAVPGLLSGFLLCPTLGWGAADALHDSERQALAERIRPVGTVCVEGAACAAAVAARTAPPVGAAADSAAALYTRGCAACHDAGISGAPRIGDRQAWSARELIGVALLYQRAIEGYNAMPPRGVCIGCSDDQVRAAVDYMLEQSR